MMHAGANTPGCPTAEEFKADPAMTIPANLVRSGFLAAAARALYRCLVIGSFKVDNPGASHTINFNRYFSHLRSVSLYHASHSFTNMWITDPVREEARARESDRES